MAADLPYPLYLEEEEEEEVRGRRKGRNAATHWEITW
jgi:hypothetical protein